ncbi:MAG: MBL fold metallo-hydrolase [Nanoarchaeota archaeon]|nr:MBL fold metallo-hydrolase [Nanoarchaeota archaeon]
MNNKLKFLGSACWQGIPGQFCDDDVSKNVKWDSKDFRFRTSLLIETKNKKTIVVEITPDIRLQAWKFRLKVPDAFLVSHWHWDHLFGLKDLDWFCEKNNPKLYGNKTTKEWYDSDMGYIPVNFKLFESYEPFIIDNIKITPFEVEHVEGTDGFIFEDIDTGNKIAYLADLCGMPEKSLDLIRNIETIIIDSTYSIGEGIDGDDTHFWENDFNNFIKKLNSKEIILTHISSHHNLNHEDLKKRFFKYTISFDGMERDF